MNATHDDALRHARKRLTEAGVWDVDGDLAVLVDRFLVRRDPAAALADFETAVTERCARIPLGHLTGSVTFDGLPLAVGSGVFVPRSESVALVAWAAATGVLPSGGRFLDLCCGVGALGLAISRRRPDASVVCVERDDTAAAYLRRNVARHAGVTGRVEVLDADLLDPGCLGGLAGADLVVANPPYVAPHVPLPPEWADHQPRDAIYSGQDGLDLIRRILAHATRTLRPAGWLGLEHDRRQPAALHELLADAGFIDIATSDDSAGEPRITVARKPDQEGS